jgi:hypothetical protein
MSTKPQAMSMKMTSSKTGETVQLRIVGKVLYINGGAGTAKDLTVNSTSAAEADKNLAAEAKGEDTTDLAELVKDAQG